MKCASVFVMVVFSLCGLPGQAAPPGLERAERSPLSSFFVAPTRIVWHSDSGVTHADSLLKPHAGQAVLKEPQPPCVLTAASDAPAGVLLDFGCELQGYVELFTPMTPNKEPVRVRVRFGESASRSHGGTRRNAKRAE